MTDYTQALEHRHRTGHDHSDDESRHDGLSRWDAHRSQRAQSKDIATVTRRDGIGGEGESAGAQGSTTEGGAQGLASEGGAQAAGDDESGRLENITGEALSKRSAGDGQRSHEALDTALRRDGEGASPAPAGEESASTRSDANLTIASTVTTVMIGQPETRNVSPFGGMVPVFDFVDISYNRTGNVLNVSFKINCTYPYGVNGGSCVDVPSATDGVVTAQNHPATGRKVYEVIKDDLMPSATSPHKSPRDHFWSRALTVRHERFHGTDDYRWASSTGKNAAKAYVDAQSIASSDIGTALGTVISEARRRMYRGSDEYYWGGTSDPGHSARSGEVRAYGDGRPHYTRLANAAFAHGRSLEGGASGRGSGGAPGSP